MSSNMERVNPGDLIRAETINSILEKIAQLEAMIGEVGTDETVSVPNVISQTIVEAIRNLRLQGLEIGSAMDGSGMPVITEASSNNYRKVIGQTPSPGAWVAKGSEVDIVVAVLPQEKPQPPEITEIEEDQPVNPGSTITIKGSNFIDPVKVYFIPLSNQGAEIEGSLTRKAERGSKLPEMIKVTVPAPEKVNVERVVTVHIKIEAAGQKGESAELKIRLKAGGEISPGIRVIPAKEGPSLPKPGEEMIIEVVDPLPDPGDMFVMIDEQKVRFEVVNERTIRIQVPEDGPIAERIKARHGDSIQITLQTKGAVSNTESIFVAEPEAKTIAKTAAGKARTIIG
jgi:hypothetical protein